MGLNFTEQELTDTLKQNEQVKIDLEHSAGGRDVANLTSETSTPQPVKEKTGISTRSRAKKPSELKISEAEWQKTVIDLAQLYGWLVHAERPARTTKGWCTPIQGNPGWPDLVLVRCNRIIIAELKSDTGKLSDEQWDWLEAINKAGIEAFVWRPRDFEEVKKILE